jgi:hypothetical protein
LDYIGDGGTWRRPRGVDGNNKLTTQGLPPNVGSNVGNNGILASGYDTGSGSAYVQLYGPGGPGTNWAFTYGGNTYNYPASTVTGLGQGVLVYVAYDTQNSYVVITTSYGGVLPDYYITIGSITTASYSEPTPPPDNGGGGTRPCCVEGTPLDTPDGAIDNRILKAQFDAGENVYLTGRYGSERVLSAEWVPVEEVVYVSVSERETFGCSTDHLLRHGGHYCAASQLSNGVVVETRDGHEPANFRLEKCNARVLRIELEGPGHEYSSHGVWTHNICIGS